MEVHDTVNEKKVWIPENKNAYHQFVGKFVCCLKFVGQLRTYNIQCALQYLVVYAAKKK